MIFRLPFQFQLLLVLAVLSLVIVSSARAITPKQAAVGAESFVKAHMPKATGGRTTFISCTTQDNQRFNCTAYTKPKSIILHFIIAQRAGDYLIEVTK